MQQICGPCRALLTLWLPRQTAAATHAVLVVKIEWCQLLSEQTATIYVTGKDLI